MLTVRYDEFNVLLLDDPQTRSSENGDAWALAYSFDSSEHWRFALEWLRVDSNVPARVELLGEPAFARESKLEFSARYSLSGSFQLFTRRRREFGRSKRMHGGILMGN